MFHLLAFRTASFGTTANTKINAVPDGYIQVLNNNFQPEFASMAIFAWSSAGDLQRTRFNMPSFNALTQPYIRPLNGSAILPNAVPKLQLMTNAPISLPALEQISLEGTDGTGTTTAYGGVGIRTSIRTAPGGSPFLYRGTSSTAAVAGTWTDLTMNYDNDLPTGTYAVVGMVGQATNSIFYRLNFTDQLMRPGCVAVTTLDNHTHPAFLNGNLGQWGTFKSTSLPTVQVLNNATDSSHEVYLQIVKLSSLA